MGGRLARTNTPLCLRLVSESPRMLTTRVPQAEEKSMEKCRSGAAFEGTDGALEPYRDVQGSPNSLGDLATRAVRRLLSLYENLSPLTVLRRPVTRRDLETRLSLVSDGREALLRLTRLLGEHGTAGVLRRRIAKEAVDCTSSDLVGLGLKGRAVKSSSEGDELLLEDGNSNTSPSSSSYCCLTGWVHGDGVDVIITLSAG